MPMLAQSADPTTTPFQWGAGGAMMTPEDVARLKLLAQQDQQSGSSYAPVASWTQGMARVADALVGGLEQHRAYEAQAKGVQHRQDEVARALAEQTSPPQSDAQGMPGQTVSANTPLNDVITAMSDPWMDEGSKQLLGTMATQSMPANVQARQTLQDALSGNGGAQPDAAPATETATPIPAAAMPMQSGFTGSGLYGAGTAGASVALPAIGDAKAVNINPGTTGMNVAPPAPPAEFNAKGFAQYAPLYQSAGAQYGIDPRILLAQGQHESSFKPDAVGPTVPGSNGQPGWNAHGIAQFKPSTAAQYGVTNSNDPTQAIPGQAHYMADLVAKNNGDIRQALNEYGGDTSGAYAEKVLGLAGKLGYTQPQATATTAPRNQVADASGTVTPSDLPPGSSHGEFGDWLHSNPGLVQAAMMANPMDATKALGSLSQQFSAQKDFEAKFGVQHPALTDDAMRYAYDTLKAGDPSMITTMGRDTFNRPRLANAIAQYIKQDGGSAEDIVAAHAALKGDTAGLVALGGRMARIDTAAAEAQRFYPLAIAASQDVPRGSLVPYNQVTQYAQSQTSDPKLATFALQAMNLANAAAVVAKRGTPDATTAAEYYHRLTTAQGPAAFKAAADAIMQEANAVRQSSRDVRNEFVGNIRSGGESAPGGGNGVAPTTPAAAPPTQADLEYTAQKYGMTIEQVRARLGVK